MINRRVSQRRKHARAEVSWPATVISKQTVLQGMVKNLGRGGALIYLPVQLEIEESVRVAIEVPECNGVISAVGEVVRSAPLEMASERFAFAAGVKFTELSEENLRFFTGNLAPEWQRRNAERQKGHMPRHDFVRSIFYGLMGLLVLSLLFYSIRASRRDNNNFSKIESLEIAMKKLEYRLAEMNQTALANQDVNKQFKEMYLELADLKSNFVSHTSVERLPEQMNVKSGTADNLSITADAESSRQPAADLPAETAMPPEEHCHIVKKGENLYQISRKYGLAINEIRAINNLSPGDSIHPNQKLIVQH